MLIWLSKSKTDICRVCLRETNKSQELEFLSRGIQPNRLSAFHDKEKNVKKQANEEGEDGVSFRDEAQGVGGGNQATTIGKTI